MKIGKSEVIKKAAPFEQKMNVACCNDRWGFVSIGKFAFSKRIQELETHLN